MMTRLGLVAIAVVGCGTTDSSSLLTSGMSAGMGARADGSSKTEVTAELFSGYPDQLIFVDLKGNDQLTATQGGQSMVMTRSQLVTIISYGASYSTDNEGDTFTIDFSRTIDAGAPSSTATLPAKLALGAVPTTSSRAASLSVTWAPSATLDPMQWQAKGDCIHDAGADVVGDPGSVTIPANTLVKQPGSTVADTCMVTVTVQRTRAGSLDAHFGKGGNIVGIQYRTATFTSTP